MKPQIVLRKANKQGLAPVSIVVNVDGKPIWFATGITVRADEWNNEKKRSRDKDENDIISKCYHRLITAITKARLTDIVITKDYLLSEYYPKQLATTVNAHKSVIDYFDYYQDKHKAKRAKNYLRSFRQVRKGLIKFKGESINWEHINQSFLDNYITFLIDEMELEDNTISMHVKRIRAIMNDAYKEGYRVPPDYQDFKSMDKSYKPFWLTYDEVKLIEQYEPTKEKTVYRDEFLFRFYTGLRWSDVASIDPSNVVERKGNFYLSFTTIKTKLEQDIVLQPKAVDIIRKYGFKFPKLYAHDCNAEIKTIAKNAGINGKVSEIRYSGSNRILKTFERWEMVTTHTARRSFARYWLDRGGDLVKLSLYLGHSSTSQTMKYVGFESEEINSELLRIF
jgi:integrase